MDLVDHSKTYTSGGLRNYFHAARLRDILRNARKLGNQYKFTSYCDVGCSNGFITEKVRELLALPAATGFDRSDNLAVGASRYSKVEFVHLDLNEPVQSADRFDFLTCFETLEHVGNVDAAIANLWMLLREDGVALITVPVEVGAVGMLKFLAKTLIFRYSLDELDATWKDYFVSLLSGRSISHFRTGADGYGTHFGFDYHDVEEKLKARFGSVTAWTKGTTRYFVVTPKRS